MIIFVVVGPASPPKVSVGAGTASQVAIAALRKYPDRP